MKLISFAVPCYNSAEYMEKCIDSILKAGEDAEILIVNDGSTKDNTAEIADKYQEKYPTICKAIHKENGGHGDAVNTGLQNATGKYFKVVDSDDWLDEQALEKVMSVLRKFETEQEKPDAVLANYVYEHVYNGKRRVISYKHKFPQGRLFDFEESKRFDVGQFLAMHSFIYRTELLREVNLQLPKHTFYVDNLFVYAPLPYVKKFYYVDADLYRYFIGRPDQSVQEEVIMKRIDQHIRVTDMMIDAHDITAFKKTRPRLYKYMMDYLLIMMVINGIYLIKMGKPEDLAKKQEIWKRFEEKSPKVCKACKRRFTGITASNNAFKRWICKVVYFFARKKFKFN